MDIKEFGSVLIKEIEKALGDGYRLDYQEVVKNNGVMYHAVTVHEKGQTVAPTIYIDEMLERYNRGEALSGLVKDIDRFLKECSCHRDIDVGFFSSFDEVTPMLSFRLVSLEANKKRLEDVPYKVFEDLAMVPVCVLSLKDIGQGSITISNKHLQTWEISVEELWENIMENTQNVFPAKISPISDIIDLGLPDAEMYEPLSCIKVISNEERVHGASVILYPGLLKKLASEADSDLYVIPSSVHEMIAFPAGEFMMDPSAIQCMIREVNNTAVLKEEILSFSLYYYNREEDCLSICG